MASPRGCLWIQSFFENKASLEGVFKFKLFLKNKTAPKGCLGEGWLTFWIGGGVYFLAVLLKASPGGF